MNWAVLLTPASPAAIAVVRLGGPGVGEFLRRHFSRQGAGGRAVHGEMRDGDRVIDDPVVVLHEGGADINVHGGPWVVREMLELARREGFETITIGIGPLPDEAVDGEGEIERQVNRLLPLARTELAVRWLLAQPALWRRKFGRSSEFPKALLYPPRVAIVGAANVGKSTLANQLFLRERSIIADMPGTTRDWVGEIADINGLAVFLMDTPGLRVSEDAIEQEAIAGSRRQVAQAELVVLVLDASQSIDEQSEWVEKSPGALVVRNKCDLPGPLFIPEKWPHVFTVGTSGAGVTSLRQAIVRQFLRPWRHPRQAIIRGLFDV